MQSASPVATAHPPPPTSVIGSNNVRGAVEGGAADSTPPTAGANEATLAALRARIGGLFSYTPPLSLGALLRLAPSVSNLQRDHQDVIERRRRRGRVGDGQLSPREGQQEDGLQGPQRPSASGEEGLRRASPAPQGKTGAGPYAMTSPIANTLPFPASMDAVPPQPTTPATAPSPPPPPTGGDVADSSAAQQQQQQLLWTQQPASPTGVFKTLTAAEVSRRLSRVVAAHTSYEIIEMLHEQAERLGYATYQDPGTNDIISTAATLRQREEVARQYVAAVLTKLRAMPAAVHSGAAGGTATATATTPWTEDELAALARHIMSVVGCHHSRERHCPHGHHHRRGPSPKRRQERLKEKGGGEAEAPAAVERLPPSRAAKSKKRTASKGGEEGTAVVAAATKNHHHHHHHQSHRRRKITPEELAVLLGAIAAPPLLRRGSSSSRQSTASTRVSPALHPRQQQQQRLLSADYFYGGGASVTLVKPPSAHPPPQPPATRGDDAAAAAVSSLDGLNGLLDAHNDSARAAALSRQVSPAIRAHALSPSASSLSHSSASTLSFSSSDSSWDTHDDDDDDDDDDDSAALYSTGSSHSFIGSDAADDSFLAVGGGVTGDDDAAELDIPPPLPRATLIRAAGAVSRQVAADAYLDSQLDPMAAAATRRQRTHNPQQQQPLPLNGAAAGSPHAVAADAEHDIVVNTFSAATGNPLMAGYTASRPFTIHELDTTAAERLLALPTYAMAHEMDRQANARGRTSYRNPVHGCLVLSSHFLAQFPHCFGEYCTHCPHGEACWRKNAMFAYTRRPDSPSSSASSPSSSSSSSILSSCHFDEDASVDGEGGGKGSGHAAVDFEPWSVAGGMEEATAATQETLSDFPSSQAAVAGPSFVYYGGQWSFSTAGMIVQANSVEDILRWELKRSVQRTARRQRRHRHSGEGAGDDAHDRNWSSASSASSSDAEENGEGEDGNPLQDASPAISGNGKPHDGSGGGARRSAAFVRRVESLEKFSHLDWAGL